MDFMQWTNLKLNLDGIMLLCCSLVESCQDPMVFTTLVLIRVLLMKNKIPEGTWDFVLCTLTTITQVLNILGY